MTLPGLELCKEEFKLIKEAKMERPQYAGIESIVKKGDAIEQAFQRLGDEMRKAFNEQVAVVETKLKSVIAENERLHHERVLLAKELQRRRSNDAKIMEILGGN
jgi:hypothetical protein